MPQGGDGQKPPALQPRPGAGGRLFLPARRKRNDMDQYCGNCGRPLAPGEECHCTDLPPEVPVYADAPQMSAAPEAPAAPEMSAAPEAPAASEAPAAPETPTAPEAPAAPEVPVAPPTVYQQPPVAPPPVYQQNTYVNVQMSPVSDKSRTVAAILAFFLGGLGVHRFYVGQVGLGLLWLFTGGLCGIGALVDFIMILCGGFKDQYGRPVTQW